jgi:hypothetical protein
MEWKISYGDEDGELTKQRKEGREMVNGKWRIKNAEWTIDNCRIASSLGSVKSQEK